MRRGYKEAMRGLRDHMLMRTDQDGLLFVGELTRGQPVPKMDHLVCFLPGESLTRGRGWWGKLICIKGNQAGSCQCFPHP